MAAMYAVYHGPRDALEPARRVQRLTAILAHGLGDLGFPVATRGFFDTLVVDTRGKLGAIAERARAARVNFRGCEGERLGISLDETTTRADVEALWALFA